MAKISRFVVVTETDTAITLPNPTNFLNDIHLQNIQAPDVDTAGSFELGLKITKSAEQFSTLILKLG